jgi:ABC-type multidrug transport system ATPase subunit
VITTHGLTKRYGRTLAVDSVDLTVREGDRYGFLGPNGSGKTTLIRLLLGLVYATRGEIELLGRPVPRHLREVLPQVGALVEGPAAYPHLSGRTNLWLIDSAGPRPGGGTGPRRTIIGPRPAGGTRRDRRRRIEQALERVGLGGIDRRPVKAYSLGMRQRLGLAAALLRAPRLLVLDEPTNGLDPRGIHEIRELLADLNAAGTTVFLSSHLLAEVEALCTRVGVVDRGRLVLQDDLAALRAPTGRVVLDSPDPAAAVALLDGQVEERDGRRLVVRHADPAVLNALLVAGGVRVAEISAERRTLEQVVLELTTASADRVDAPAPRADRAAPADQADPTDRAVPTDRGDPTDRGAGAGGP